MVDVAHGSTRTTGKPLFGRRVRVLYAAELPGEGNYSTITTRAVQVTDLRVEFSIKRSLRKQPNTGKIVISNLPPDSRSFMTGKGAKLILEAGYENGMASIFSGDVRYVDHDTSEATTKSTFEVGDGERAYRHARINQSFGAGTPAGKLLGAIVGALGVKHGNIASFGAKLDASGIYENGYAAHGSAAAELDRVLGAAGLEWSIQDGAIQILEPQSSTGRVYVLSSTTGLIGSPQYGSPPKKGKPRVLHVMSLIQPYNPGDEIELESETVKGRHKVLEVEFKGDTHGAPWTATLDVIPVVK